MKRKLVMVSAIVMVLLSPISAKADRGINEAIPESPIEVKGYHECLDNGGYHEDCWGK